MRKNNTFATTALFVLCFFAFIVSKYDIGVLKPTKMPTMIKSDVFTYQISPITTGTPTLFDEIEQVTQSKNEIFSEIFNSLHFTYQRKGLNYKIVYKDDNFILIRLANKKTIRKEKNFKVTREETEPSTLIAFHNDPDVQLIAIESDKTSFGNSFTVLKILEKAIDRELIKRHLRFYPQPKYEQKILWDLLKNNEGSIEKLQFSFSKPNLARVNSSLSEDLKEAAKAINSETTKIAFEAPKDHALENLDENNKPLADLVKASSEGAGPAKVKVKGLKYWQSTETSVKSLEIDELEAEADPETILSFVQELKRGMENE